MKERKEFLAGGRKTKGTTSGVKKFLNFIVLVDQPVLMAENTGFRSLTEHLQPRYSLPSRRYLLETELPELYNRVSTKLFEKEFQP